MRNFSMNNVTKFVSYNINCGEYLSEVDTLDVLGALAKAFSVPYSYVLSDFNNLIAHGEDMDYHWDPKCCSSEVDVLVNLYEFVRSLGERCPKGVSEHAENFVYINLNTGESVVWTHMVC